MENFVAFGNEEISGKPMIVVGSFIDCPAKCGNLHEVKDSKPAGLLQSVKCGETVYLVGIGGKDIRT